MAQLEPAVKPQRGRPPKPADQRLVPYGLHLMPDMKGKMLVVKTIMGSTVRDLLEGFIEERYQKLVREGKIEPDAWKAALEESQRAEAGSITV